MPRGRSVDRSVMFASWEAAIVPYPNAGLYHMRYVEGGHGVRKRKWRGEREEKGLREAKWNVFHLDSPLHGDHSTRRETGNLW